MYKEKITYVDFDGNERTEDLYFNLSKTELLEMQISEEGGFDKKLEKIIESGTDKEVYMLMRDVVEKSYGIKSADGRKFQKTKEIFDDFASTNAFDEFVWALVNDVKRCEAFVNGVINISDLEKRVAEIEKQKMLEMA